MSPPRPVVRVHDATLHPDAGPVRVAVSGLSSPQAVADELASAGARVAIEHGRLVTVTTPSRLVDATGRALGRGPAEALGSVLERAVAAWAAPPPDIVAPGVELACSERPVVMGVLNVTPDSFSDGGVHYDPDDHPGRAVAHGRALVEDGADVVDVGGESTRPGAEPVPEDEELKRVIPVVEELAASDVVVSIDTSKAAVARAAVDAGARIVNDVSGGADADMLAQVAQLGVPYVLMHMQGTPATMQDDPRYDDVVAEVFDFLADGLRRCVDAGIDPSHTIVDPGIGFGKTVEHNLRLLERTRELTSLGRPVLIGASRKSFLSRAADAEDRLAPSLAAAAVAVSRGAAMVRVHDVAETVAAVRAAHAIATAHDAG